MNLISFNFVLFLTVALALYYILPQKLQWVVLLTLSFLFYAFSGPRYFIYILTTIFSTYFGAKFIDQNNKSNARELVEKDKINIIIIILVIVLNIGILFVLKYSELFLSILNIPHNYSFIIPLGMSFYTLQAVGYVIDVKYRRVEPSDNIFKYALFISYFPLIIQGPISEFEQLYHQFFEDKKFDYDNTIKALILIIFGVFKKIVIADRAAVVVNAIFTNPQEYEGIMLFMGAAFYSIQIYGDFSGGIDIIRGVSQLFGIELVDNFKRPYFSKSITEFWQRWHITLGAWMRKYVFYPLALSKSFGKLSRKTRKKFGNHLGKQIPAALASLIVFVLVGAWHGSSVKYIAYGLYNGFFVLSEPILRPIYKKTREKLKINKDALSFKLFQIMRTTFIIIIGRFFSRANRFLTSVDMIKRTFTTWNPWVLFDGSLFKILERKEMNVLFIAILVLFVISYLQEKGTSISEELMTQSIVLRWPLIIMFILFILIFGYYGPHVRATDFIYGGF